MPIYEYICTKCGHEFDEIQKFSDLPLKKCPKCKGKLEKKMSAPSFQLKGTGWYATDFKDKPKAPASTPPKTPVAKDNKSETSSTPTTKPENKPEGKAENEYLSRGQDPELHPKKNNPNFAPMGASFSRDKKTKPQKLE